MSDALVPICPRCGRRELEQHPGQAPRCRWCGRALGLAPAELQPRSPGNRRSNLPPRVPSGNAREDALDQRRRNQVAHQQPAHFAATRPISTERTRLDLRLSVDLRDQLNDLVARHGVTASEIIRQAVEALWDREIGIVDD